MFKKTIKFVGFIAFIGGVGALGYYFYAGRSPQEEPFEYRVVHLESGIRQGIHLGDTEHILAHRIKKPCKKEFVSQGRSGAAQLGLSFMLDCRNLGTKAYFRNNQAVLLEIEPPFKGEIQGRNFKLFLAENTNGKPWEEFLMRRLGLPKVRASGGPLGTRALFYDWGDITFGRGGPTQIALYRDLDISKFRQNHFGREVEFFEAP